MRSYKIGFFVVTSIVALIAFQNASSPEQMKWPMININFDNDNTLTTASIVNAETGEILRTEPLDPRINNETGAAHTAIGRPLYRKSKESDFPDLTSTIAPGTNYSMGINSECVSDANLERCARDNSYFVRLNPNSRDLKKDNSIQDKALVRAVQTTHPKALAMDDGDPLIRYFSFDFKFDRYYERSKSWTMHMQAFQEGGGPALSLQMIRTLDFVTPAHLQELEMSVIALNDRVFAMKEEPGSPSAIKHQSDFGVIDVCRKTNIKFEREKWYNITLKMAPSAQVGDDGKEKGEIAFYVNGEFKCHYRGNWGFIPKPELPRPTMGLDLGVYRARSNTQQMIIFDNVKYGPTFKSIKETGSSRVPWN